MDLTIKFILDSDSLKEPRDHQLTHMNQITDSFTWITKIPLGCNGKSFLLWFLTYYRITRLSRDFILFSPTDKPERIEIFYCPIIENRRVVWFSCKNEIYHLEHHGKMHLAFRLIAALMGIITITTATEILSFSKILSTDRALQISFRTFMSYCKF